VWEPTFTITTTNANTTAQPIHDRMPVILPEDVADEWLYPRRDDFAGPSTLLAPAANDLLVVMKASPRVNSVRNDDPACLVPVP
jgi:putative SOS response-associated peptidase YedK